MNEMNTPPVGIPMTRDARYDVLFTPLRIWSLFANFCVLPVIGLMFVAEYAVRRRVLPQVPRRGILAAVRVYFAKHPNLPSP